MDFSPVDEEIRDVNIPLTEDGTLKDSKHLYVQVEDVMLLKEQMYTSTVTLIGSSKYCLHPTSLKHLVLSL